MPRHDQSILEKIKNSFEGVERIEERGYFQTVLDRCRSKRDQVKYLKMLDKAQVRIEKELDLQRFFRRSRAQVRTMLGLLLNHQMYFVDKMSQLVIDDESAANTDSDTEVSNAHDGSVDSKTSL